MIMDRENEINGFRSQEYETLTADLGGFQAVWRASGGILGSLTHKKCNN